jgi:hypothetical protein
VRCKGLPAEPGAPVAAMQATMLLRASPAPLARPLLAASRASAAGGARLRASPLALPPLRCRRRVAVAHAPRAAASAAGGAPAAGSPDDPFKARRRHRMRILPFRVRSRNAPAGCVSTARAVGRSTQTLSRCVSATSLSALTPAAHVLRSQQVLGVNPIAGADEARPLHALYIRTGR